MTKGIILSLGSINADFQFRTHEPPGSTTTMMGSNLDRLGGGKAANVAFLGRKLGKNARLIGRVGEDDLREQALAPLRRAGIDLQYVRSVPGCATAVSFIMVPPEGEKSIVLIPNANDAWEESDAAEAGEAVRNAPPGSVLVADCEVATLAVKAAVAAAGERGFPVILDPAPPDRVDDELLQRADYIVPDASETESLTGIYPEDAASGAEAARRLREQGPDRVLIKLSEGGCVVTDGKDTFHVPPVKVEIVDTTGAGDAFAGALAVAVLEGRPLREAACFAAAASLATVTGWGSQPAYPDRDRIEHFCNQLLPQIKSI